MLACLLIKATEREVRVVAGLERRIAEMGLLTDKHTNGKPIQFFTARKDLAFWAM